MGGLKTENPYVDTNGHLWSSLDGVNWIQENLTLPSDIWAHEVVVRDFKDIIPY